MLGVTTSSDASSASSPFRCRTVNGNRCFTSADSGFPALSRPVASCFSSSASSARRAEPGAVDIFAQYVAFSSIQPRVSRSLTTVRPGNACV